MPAATVRGFQINTVLDRLAWDVLLLLGDALAEPRLDRDRLNLGLLLTLSRRAYVHGLLFRDFAADPDEQWHLIPLGGGGAERISDQAILYLEKVLARRPRLARRLLEQPGNTHLLFGALCRFGQPADDWRRAEVRRDQGEAERGGTDDPAFRAVAAALARQRAALGLGYAAESRRRRMQYGPIWLVCGAGAAELPEEMSLFDAIEATPVPLLAAFVEDPDVQRLLARVLDALNERYTLLRSCGLDPALWHDRDEPSIACLRDLKQLRRFGEEALRTGLADSRAAAYRVAFDDLKGQSPRFGGFAGFDAFAASEEGQTMLRQRAPSLDDLLTGGDDDDGEGVGLAETIADPASLEAEDEAHRRLDAPGRIAALIDDNPDLFDPLMARFFREVIGRGRPLFGDPGLLRDPAFRELVAADPACAPLEDDGALAEHLCRRADRLTALGLRRLS